MKKAVFGLVDTEAKADRIVNNLLAAGFANRDISILSPNSRREGREDYVVDENISYREDVAMHEPSRKKGGMGAENHTKAPEGGVAGAAAGGLLGGSLGLLAGIGALAIPGLGAFIAAGPIMAALSGTAIGAAAGGVVGGLIGFGIPEYEVEKYEAGLQSGNTLLSVHVETSDELDKAKDIFKKGGAKDISSSQEKAKSH